MDVLGPFYILAFVCLTVATFTFWLTGGMVAPEWWRALAVGNAIWIPIVALMWAVDA